MSPPNYLKPNETLAEVVAGLIMVLSFTLAASVASGGGQDGARAALVGAIGCNVAWAIIDAVFYLMDSAFGRNRLIRIGRAVASAPDEAAALATIRGELDPYLASIARTEDREHFYRGVRSWLLQKRPPRRADLTRDDYMGAVAVFCLVVATALPAVLPLLLISDPWIALRASNLLVIVVLFVVGYYWAGYVDTNRWLAGFGLTALGLALVAVAIPLGG
jgi:hypothetical protein